MFLKDRRAHSGSLRAGTLHTESIKTVAVSKIELQFFCHIGNCVSYMTKTLRGIALWLIGIVSLKRPSAGGKFRKRDSLPSQKYICIPLDILYENLQNKDIRS